MNLANNSERSPQMLAFLRQPRSYIWQTGKSHSHASISTSSQRQRKEGEKLNFPVVHLITLSEKKQRLRFIIN